MRHLSVNKRKQVYLKEMTKYLEFDQETLSTMYTKKQKKKKNAQGLQAKRSY